MTKRCLVLMSLLLSMHVFANPRLVIMDGAFINDQELKNYTPDTVVFLHLKDGLWLGSPDEAVKVIRMTDDLVSGGFCDLGGSRICCSDSTGIYCTDDPPEPEPEPEPEPDEPEPKPEPEPAPEPAPEPDPPEPDWDDDFKPSNPDGNDNGIDLCALTGLGCETNPIPESSENTTRPILSNEGGTINDLCSIFNCEEDPETSQDDNLAPCDNEVRRCEDNPDGETKTSPIVQIDCQTDLKRCSNEDGNPLQGVIEISCKLQSEDCSDNLDITEDHVEVNCSDIVTCSDHGKEIKGRIQLRKKEITLPFAPRDEDTAHEDLKDPDKLLRGGYL